MRTRIPLYVHIATLFLLLFLVLGFSLVFQGYRQTLSGNFAHERQNFAHQSAEVEQSLQLTIRPVSTSLLLYSRSRAVTAQTLEQRLSELPQFTELLRSNEAVSAVYIGYNNGDFFLIRKLTIQAQQALQKKAPENAHFLVQSIDSSQGKSEGIFLFYDAQLRMLESRAMPDYVFDPRSRIWYQDAQQHSGVVMARPYIFYTTQEPGSTLAIKADSGNAVIGADLSMQNLSQLLANMPRPQGSELVMFDDEGQLIAAARELTGNVKDSHTLPRLDLLNVPILKKLYEEMPKQKPAIGTQQELDLQLTDDARWIGYLTAMPSGSEHTYYLSLLLPTDSLYAPARNNALESTYVTLFMLLIMLPCVWYVAKHTARPLSALKQSIEAIRNFDFEEEIKPLSRILEINELADAMTSMRLTIHNFISIDKALVAEHKFDPLLTRILQETLKVVAASGGVIYLRQDKDKRMEPVRALWQQNEISGLSGFSLSGEQEHSLRPAINGRQVAHLLDEASWRRDFMPLAPFDERYLLVAEPLLSRRKEVIGILVVVLLRNREARDINARINLISALAGTSAVAIETQRLIEEQKHLLESFIELVAGAIDAKSAYTGGHCQRVPELTRMLAQAACEQHEGPFTDFNLDDEQWEELHIASWLHDCGKVTTPEYVVDKATKLEMLYDRIHEIRMRFEVLKRDAHIAALNEQLSEAQRQTISDSLQSLWKKLDEEFAFVAECNLGSEVMATDRLERLRQIANRKWMRTLDDRLGVSYEELQRKMQVQEQTLPCMEPLLSDRPEHLIPRPVSEQLSSDNPWGFRVQVPEYLYNRGELYNLSVTHGTLTDEERYKINQHIIQTIIMLSKLPFPQHLKNVPEIAGGHHEKMDGSGYPKRLVRDELSIPARMIAIADIFEALTASDRPYKPGKTTSEALRIMQRMVQNNHIDRELFVLFVQSGIWRVYAEHFLLPEQRTPVDQEELLAGITADRPAG